MRVVVTGGMGFIGTEVVKLALREKHEVIVVDFLRELIPLYESKRYPILDDVYDNLSRCQVIDNPWEFVYDVTQIDAQVVIHAGAVVDTKDLGSEKLFDNNIMYTRQLVERTSRSSSIPTPLVFISSASVYGAAPRMHPVNPYALTKAIGENIVRASQGRRSILRLFNVFGKNEHHKGEMASVPFKLAQAYLSGDRFDMFCPDAERDFVPVSTVARSILDAASSLLLPTPPASWDCMTYDVGTGTPTSFRDLDNFVMQATHNRAIRGRSSVIREIPMPKELVGRYQGYTRAGAVHGTPVLGFGSCRAGVEEMYGH